VYLKNLLNLRVSLNKDVTDLFALASQFVTAMVSFRHRHHLIKMIQAKRKVAAADSIIMIRCYLVGLFRKLPPPEAEWSEGDRLKWLQTAANIFDLVYTGDCGGFVISPARAERSPRPRDRE